MNFEFKLGAILGKRDPRNIQLGLYLKPKLIPAPPQLIDWISGHQKSLHMWANDEHGDCVFAAKYNIESVAGSWTKKPFKATDKDVLNDYAAVTGFNPVTGANDNGANPEDALRYYSKLPDNDPRKIVAWGEVDRKNFKELRQALQIFGGLFTALALPLTAQDQLREGKIWDVVSYITPNRIPGSWGGHMVASQMINASGKKILGNVDTWGTTQKFTEAFWRKYCSVAYFFITKRWLDRKGKTPSGLDLKTMLADVQELKAA